MSIFVQALRNSIRYTGYRRPLLVVSALTFSLFWLTVLSVGIGAVTVSPAQVITILAEQVGLPGWVSYEPVQKAILLNIRLPRVVLAILTGAALAVSGAAMQGLFRNPLADPGLIGVSSGAAQIGRASCSERSEADGDGIRDGHVTGVQTCALPI